MSNAKRSTIEVQGTSIAILSHERQDFLSKMSIAYKEARETHHWLRLLRDSDILDNRQAGSVIEDCAEPVPSFERPNRTFLIRNSK